MSIIRTLFVLLFTGWLAAPAVALADPGAAEILLRLSDGYTPQLFLSNLRAAHPTLAAGLRYARPVGRRFNIHVFRYDPRLHQADALLEQVQRQPGVAAAQANEAVEFRNQPNDPDYSRQWGLERIGAPEVWNVSTGGKTALGHDIVIAILDSGFDVDHEDLRDNIWINSAEIAGDGIDNDKNGYVDDVRGWNFIDSSAVHRVETHGHSVTGIAGARGNNGIGVSGVGWNVKLMVLDIRLVDQIVAAYEYVLDQRERFNNSNGKEGALVVATNASFGLSRVFCERQPVWGGMYDQLGAEGVLTASGTANSAWDVDEVGDMPTTCPSNFLLSVLNSNEQDERHQGSAYGQQSIDMGAPGQNSYTTRPFNEYGTFNGTSAAAPHLTGAIALMYGLPCEAIAEGALRQPAETALQIRELLLRGIDPIPALESFTATGGRLNVATSMELAQELCQGSNGPLALLRLYPNPVSEELVVEFETPNFDPYLLRVFNALGQEVFRNAILPSRFAVKRERIPVWRLAPGMYVLRLEQEQESVVGKFLVQH